jgi:hypothetical protein
MKKFMFSAIAMIAFVGSIMAADVAEKEIIVKSFESEKISQIEVEEAAAKDCGVAKFSTYVDAKSAGFTHDQATAMSWSVYYLCMGENSKMSTSIQP